MGNREHGKYYMDKLPWYLKKAMRKDVEPVPPLYQFGEYQERAGSVAEPSELGEKKGTAVIA